MICKLYLIELFEDNKKVYDANLPFMGREPNDEDIISFMKLIRPNLKFDKIKYTFVKMLEENY